MAFSSSLLTASILMLWSFGGSTTQAQPLLPIHRLLLDFECGLRLLQPPSEQQDECQRVEDFILCLIDSARATDENFHAVDPNLLQNIFSLRLSDVQLGCNVDFDGIFSEVFPHQPSTGLPATTKSTRSPPLSTPSPTIPVWPVTTERAPVTSPPGSFEFCLEEFNSKARNFSAPNGVCQPMRDYIACTIRVFKNSGLSGLGEFMDVTQEAVDDKFDYCEINVQEIHDAIVGRSTPLSSTSSTVPTSTSPVSISSTQRASSSMPHTTPTTHPAPTTTKPISTSTNTKPSSSQPSTTKSSPSQPSTTKPSSSQPSTTKSSSSQPSTTKPSSSQPSTTAVHRPCIRSAQDCRVLPTGDYAACMPTCMEGTYYSCVFGRVIPRHCPLLGPFQYYSQTRSIPLVYDPISARCDYTSNVCPRAEDQFFKMHNY